MFPVTTTGEAHKTDRKATLSGGTVWAVPEEVPVAFVYNRRNYAIMLATPDDLADFATGFSLSEQVVDRPDDIAALAVHHSPRGIDLSITISPACLERFDLRQRRRNLPGSAGCGICGLENAEELFAPPPKVAEAPIALDPDIIAGAMASLADAQPLNARTRSVHAAAWVDMGGQIGMVREDVGRHNALDKLLGARALAGGGPAAGFVLMSSRCSWELVEKAARAGVRAIATLSAPTHFALRRAEQANIALYARTADGVARITETSPEQTAS